MKLIVGLGNPGPKYSSTRHNLGYMAVDHWISCLAADPTGGTCPTISGLHALTPNERFNALVTSGKFDNEKVVFMLPLAFMNLSGDSVQSIAHFYRIRPKDVWIAHDDLDIPFGEIRVQKGRGAAGHNGVKSVIERLGSKEFVRFRLGIKPKKASKLPSEKFVLKKFSRAEAKQLPEILDTAQEAMRVALVEGVEETMNRFNG